MAMIFVRKRDIPASGVEISKLGTPTYDSMQDLINVLLGEGLVEGGVISDAGSGTIDITLAKCFAKITDTEITTLKTFELAAQVGVALTDGLANFISVDYNGGAPILQVDTTGADFWAHDHVFIGTVFRDGTTLHISNVGSQITNFNTRLLRKDAERVNTSAERVPPGLLIGSSGLNLTLSAGVYYVGFARKISTAWDTSGADDFSYWYNDGAWQEVAAQSDINELQYNDFGTGLATLSNNKYGVHWVFQDFDGEDHHVVYGIGDYTLSEALDAAVPSSLPAIVGSYSFLVGKVIVQKSAAIIDAQAPWNGAENFQAATDHEGLSNLLGGAFGEHYHMTAAQHAALEVENNVSTTDATVTTLVTIPIPDDTVVWIEADVIARRTNAADRAKYKRGALIYREAAGVAVIEGSIWTPLTIESDASWECTITVSGNNALVRITGAGGHDINWESQHAIEERA